MTVSLLCALLSLRLLSSIQHFTVTAAQAVLEFPIPHQLLIVGENQVHHNTFHPYHPCHFEQEVIINIF